MPGLRSRLYLRIWLAVVAAVAVLSLLLGWAWRLSREERSAPTRELLVRDESGQVIGQARSEGPLRPGRALQVEVQTQDGRRLQVELSRPPLPPGHGPGRPPGPPGWPAPWPVPSFLWLIAVVAVAVALGAYPIIRRLTQRLEALQRGVERWGEGELSARVPVEGRDEVAYLAERFNQVAERIEQLLASHKTLLANASHELRSPLARLRMGLELLEGGTATQREEMRRNIQELDQLIDEILLASRLDAAPAEADALEPVDLLGLAAEECARTGAELVAPPALAGQPGPSGVWVPGAPRLLRRLLRNLLENARRHGAGEVELSLGVERDAVEIRVCDRGPGVAPALRERIFEPFFRLPGASEHEGGVGLGLALVNSIAQRHRGQVHCEERPGGGACFVVRLPLA